MNVQKFNDSAHVRDHLANERTYLAWLRTGMSMMGFGVVIAKLRYLFVGMTVVPPATGIIHLSDIGLLFAAAGFLIIMVSGWRHNVIRDQIRNQNYSPSKRIVIFLWFVMVVLGVFVIGYLAEDMLTAR